MKKKKRRQVFRNNYYMLQILYKASRWRLLLECAFYIARGVVQTLIYTVLFGNIVKALERGDSFKSVAMFIAVVAFVTCILVLYEIWFMDVYTKYDNNRIQKYLMKDIFDHAAKLDLSHYEDPDFYDKYVRSLEEASQRCIRLSAKVGEFCGVIVTAGFLMSVIIPVDYYIMILVFLPIVSSYFLGRKKNQYDYVLSMSNTKPTRKAQYVNRVMYLGKYAKDIKVSNIYKCLIAMYQDNMDQVITNHKKYNIRSALCKLLMDVIADNFINICILIYITYRIVVSKTLLVGDYLIAHNAVSSMTWRIQWLIQSYLQFDQFAMHIENYKTFMDTKVSTEIKQSDRKVDLSNTLIEFKNLSFSYDGNKNVLSNINLSIQRGKKIALVGHNGAGKSTLIKLLLRLYNPTEGEILWNDINVMDYDLTNYRKAFSTIFQDFQLYAFNVGENVTTSMMKEKDIADIDMALEKSQLTNRIKKLPKGIYTSVTKEFDVEGFSPSGGESQKLATARAIYRNSEVFIMDEPSSALDPLAEAKINELMMNSAMDKTIIMISHRLSSTMSADEIYLLDRGSILEHGNHEELMKLDGVYAEMFKKQAESYHLPKNHVDNNAGGLIDESII